MDIQEMSTERLKTMLTQGQHYGNQTIDEVINELILREEINENDVEGIKQNLAHKKEVVDEENRQLNKEMIKLKNKNRWWNGKVAGMFFLATIVFSIVAWLLTDRFIFFTPAIVTGGAFAYSRR